MGIRKLLSIIFLTTSMMGYADMTQPDHYLLSPNATSLGEYGAIPVSLYTGIPEISIPVIEVSSGTHTLPISLSYHGGGVRPDQHPGWVGLGWTLNAGGCVSRIVNGIPDETYYYNVTDGYYTELVSADVNSPEIVRRYGYFYYGKGGISDNGEYPMIDSFSEIKDIRDEIEREPDQFCFNALGLQGSFYYHVSENRWIVQSDHNVKIEFDIYDPLNYWTDVFCDKYDSPNRMFGFTRSRVINNFKIIDEYGNSYYFGGEKNAVEYSVGLFSQSYEQPCATTWHLTKIEYADGNIINFNYQKKDYTVQLGVSEYLYELTTVMDGSINTAYYNGERLNLGHSEDLYNQTIPSYISHPTISSDRGYVQGSLISPSYLENISSDIWKVSFGIEESHELPYYLDELCKMHYYTTPVFREEYLYPCKFSPDGSPALTPIDSFEKVKYYKLTSITVKDSEENIVETHKLVYNDTDSDENPRLALLELKHNESGKTYSFEYDNLELLPPYCTYNIDHWGFNKMTYITSHKKSSNGESYLITRHTALKSPNYESSRNSNENQSLYGSLVKITYPTGGYTRLEYEANSYIQSVDSTHSQLIRLNSIQVGGGIRVKNIFQSYSGKKVDEELSKTYTYNNIITDGPRESSGILLRPWRYMILLNNRDIADFGDAGYLFRCKMWTSGNVNPINQYSESACVTYTWVTEKNPDDSFTVYNFSNFDNGYPDERQPNSGEIQGEYSGLKINIPYYSHAPSRGQLLSKASYDKNRKLIDKTETSYKKDGSFIRVDEQRVYTIPVIRNVAFRAKKELCQRFQKLHTFFIPTYTVRPDSVTITEYFEGNQTLQQTSIREYHTGNLPKSETVILSNGEKTKSVFEYLDAFEDSDDGEALRESHKVGILKSVRNYLYDSNGNSYLRDYVKYGFKDRSPVYPDTITTGFGDLNVYERTVQKYDSVYNITEIVKDGAPPTVYVWGYNGKYPVAKIVNARLSEVEAQIGNLHDFSFAGQPDFSKLTSLRSRLPEAQVWIYRFQPLVGLIEATDPSGNTVRYTYDAAGRLNTILDPDGNFSDVYFYNYAQ